MARIDANAVLRAPIALALLAMTLLAVGCSTEGTASEGEGATPQPEETAGSAATASAAYDFPTGPAVLVPVSHEPPTGRVDATGGYLPANGKPTLVFAESIT